MSATAENLKDLHELHQRAKALRARLSSGPKTLAVSQSTLATRTAELEKDRKALQDAKVQLKKQEHSLQVIDDQNRRPEDQAQPRQEKRRVQGPSEPDRSRGGRQVEDRGRDPGSARGYRNPLGRRRQARSRRETIRRRSRRARAADRERSDLSEGPARRARNGDRPGRGRDPRRTPGPVSAYRRRGMGPTRWPSARMARASAVTRHSRRRWSTTS